MKEPISPHKTLRGFPELFSLSTSDAAGSDGARDVREGNRGPVTFRSEHVWVPRPHFNQKVCILTHVIGFSLKIIELIFG